MKKSITRLLGSAKKRSGQSLIEYALIVALIAVAAIPVLQGIGGSVSTKLTQVNTALR
jgi:Flp pilus assembly pilin Flp